MIGFSLVWLAAIDKSLHARPAFQLVHTVRKEPPRPFAEERCKMDWMMMVAMLLVKPTEAATCDQKGQVYADALTVDTTELSWKKVREIVCNNSDKLWYTLIQYF